VLTQAYAHYQVSSKLANTAQKLQAWMQKAGHGKQLLEVIWWRSDERRWVLLSALSYADLGRSWLVLGARISLREIRHAPLTLSLALTTLIKIYSTRFSLRSRDVNRTIALSIAIMFGNIQCVEVRAAGGINRCGARSGPARTRFKGMAYHNVGLTVQCIYSILWSDGDMLNPIE
jgi:hypothetical protein